MSVPRQRGRTLEFKEQNVSSICSEAEEGVLFCPRDMRNEVLLHLARQGVAQMETGQTFAEAGSLQMWLAECLKELEEAAVTEQETCLMLPDKASC